MWLRECSLTAVISLLILLQTARRWNARWILLYILLYDKKISNLKDMLPILEAVAQSGRPLLIIAEDVDNEALATLVVNRLRGLSRYVRSKLPLWRQQTEMLEDIAVLTGGTVISEVKGMQLTGWGQ